MSGKDDLPRRRRAIPVKHLLGGPVGMAAVLVTAAAVVLEALDLTVPRFRHWWAGRPLTTTIVGGFLVVLVTVLVVDRVLNLRQLSDRAKVMAAQAAIVMAQADRSAQAVSATLDASGDRDAASDEVRTYMSMLLVAAPILIDAKRPREFLMEAQHLGAELARLLGSSEPPPPEASTASERIDTATQRLRTSSIPLLAVFDREQRTAVGAPDERPTAA